MQSKAGLGLGVHLQLSPLPTLKSKRGRLKQQLRKPKLFVAIPWERQQHSASFHLSPTQADDVVPGLPTNQEVLGHWWEGW